MDERPPDFPPDPPYAGSEPPSSYSPPPSYAPYEPPPPPPESPARPPLPFEDLTRPWLNSFFETIGLFVRRPREGFERMSLTGDLLRPVVYALILGSAGYVLSAAWQGWVNATMQQYLPSGSYEPDMSPVATVWLAALSPLIFVVLATINVLISHVCLLVVGSGKSGIGATLRAICYAQTAMIAMIIPGCGSIIAPIWYIVLEVIGFATAHKTTYGRALVAVLIPSVLCCACIALCVALFGTAIMNAMQSMK